MMAQKYYLHELLKEDQEPFLLNKYISDRRSQMIKRPSPKTKRKPFNQIQNSNLPISLCKNACLFPFPETPDLRKSPLFELPSPPPPPPKSPCSSPNKIFLHINSRIASHLLEAALRIQTKTKTQTKTKGFGLFRSLFKKLKQRNHNRNGSGKAREKMDSEKDKDNNMETSCSGHSYDFEGIIHFVTNHEDSAFCESPFRFVLQTGSCSGSHTPELASPSRHITEDKESNGAEESLNQLKSGEEEEEEKEQCSPVSVLDPPFEDDDEGHGNDDDDEGDTDGFDLESSYAIVQRARQQILYKLCRFEKLAELDPVELEKRMQEQAEDEDETFMEEDDYEDEEMEASCKENDLTEQVFEAVFLSRVHDDKQQIPQELKKLISDLIVEEEKALNNFSRDRDMVMSRICKRLELWKEVESNTIDMMIEKDFYREDVGWKKNVEQISQMAGELELAIFGFLVEEFSEEFSEELVC